MKKARAFTLIEVLLAVAIFAIVLSAIHMVFYGALQLRKRTTEAIERGLPLQQALAIMQRDLAGLVLPGGTFFGEFQTTASNTTTNALDMLSPVNNTIVGQSGPAFFTASGLIQEGLPWSEVQRVMYYLAPTTNDAPGKDLIRSVTRNLLPIVQELPEQQRLLSGVQSLIFSFYDGLQWREYWDSTVESNGLPLGVKVQLQMLAPNGERTRQDPIEIVVPVVLQAGTNQTSLDQGEEQ
jgi:type II secretion system protein J